MNYRRTLYASLVIAGLISTLITWARAAAANTLIPNQPYRIMLPAVIGSTGGVGSGTPQPTTTPTNTPPTSTPSPTNTPSPSPSPMPTGEPSAIYPLPLQVATTIESAGIVAPYLGDDNQNATAAAYYRAAGAAEWLEAHAMTPDYAAQEWRVSLVYLMPGTLYDIEVRFSDPDGASPAVVAASATTRPEYPEIGTNGVIHTVADNDALKTAIRNAQPGDTIQLQAGAYAGDIEIGVSDSGAPGANITIEPAPGAEVVFDGSDPDVNGPEDNWTFYQSTQSGSIYYTDLAWGDHNCGGATMLPNFAAELVNGEGKRFLLFPNDNENWSDDFLPAPPGKAWYVCNNNGPEPDDPRGRLYVQTYEGDDPDNHEIYVSRYRRALELRGADYIRIRDFEFRYYSLTAIQLAESNSSGADHNIIEDNDFHGIGEWHIRIVGSGDNGYVNNNLIQNNTFTEAGYRDSQWQWDVYYHDGRGDVVGVSLSFAGPGNVIRNNTFTGGHDGINANNDSSDVDIYGNTISECMDNAIEVDSNPGQNVRIWDNTVLDCFASISFQSWVGSRQGPVYFFRNVIDGGDDPLGRKDDRGSSKGYDGTHAFKLGGHGAVEGYVYLYHNTISIVRSEAGQGHGLNDAAGEFFANAISRNNIWHVTGDVYNFDFDTSIANHNFDCDNLHKFDGQAFTFIKWGTDGGQNGNGTYRTLADFQTTTGQQLSGLSDNGTIFGPLWQLLDGSPDIDAGCVIVGFNDRGAEMFAGPAPDLGAYENR